MRNLKKILALVLALVMSLSLVTMANADFSDAADISKTEAVEVMAAAGILEGSDGKFDPKGTLTREQAAKIITYVLKGAKEADKLSAAIAPFADVAATRWSAGAIAFCATEGIVDGVGGGNFNPTGKLTGSAFAKMLLVALGFDAAENGLTGAAWEINTAKLYIAEDLDTNLSIDLSKELSREDAAQMALNAMVWTDKGELWGIVGSGLTFESQKDAALYAAILDKSAEDVVKVPASEGTLLLDTHKITRTTSAADALGRPATTYAHGDWDSDLVFAKTADFTFTTAMKEKDIFKAVGAAGIQGQYDKYIEMTEIYINGVNEIEGSAAGTKVVAKNDSSNAAGFGNGVTVELFKTDVANKYVMVAYNEYISTVKSIVKADADKGVKRQIVITGAGNFETESFEKGDVVLYTLDKNGVATVKAPETISGKVTKIANGTNYTIGGEVYVLSQNAKTTLSMGAEGTWYVDSCGNIIDVKSATAADVYYGYLLAYAKKTKADADLFGENADVNGEKVKFVNAKGETVTLDTAFETDKNGNVTKFIAADAGWTTSSKNVLFGYELNSKGEISKIYAATDAPNGTAKVTKGDATMSGSSLALTGDTVFFYVDLTAGSEKYVAYTGYKTAPTKEGTVLGRVYADGKMKAVVLSVADVNVESDKQYVYFGGTDVDVESTEDGDVYTYTNVYVNGEKTSLKNDGALTFTVGHIYEYTTDSDGYTTLVDADDATPGVQSVVDATAAGTEITLVQETYFKKGGNVYVDDATVYYEIDQANNILSVVEGLPALSDKDAYDVMWLYNDKGNASDNAADLVVFFVK